MLLLLGGNRDMLLLLGGNRDMLLLLGGNRDMLLSLNVNLASGLLKGNNSCKTYNFKIKVGNVLMVYY